MSQIQGVICPNCGIHHNSVEQHRCKWSNPAYARHRAIKLQLRRQHYRCASCRRQLFGRMQERHPRDDQYIYDEDERCICVACSDSLKERRAEYVV